MKHLSNFTLRALVVLGLLLSCGNTQAEDFGLRWEKTFRPFEFWDQATIAQAQVFADEKGGCMVKLTAIRPINQRKEIFIFLDEHGAERYRFESPQGRFGSIQLLSSKGAVFYFGSEDFFETVSFSETGEVVRTASPNNFGRGTPLDSENLLTDRKSFWYTVTSSESAGGIINAVIRKFSFGTNDSPEPAPVLFSGVNGDNAIVAWNSKVGSRYQVQKSSDLQSWSNIGLPITGTGEQMNYSEANLGEPLYLRIVVL